MHFKMHLIFLYSRFYAFLNYLLDMSLTKCYN